MEIVGLLGVFGLVALLGAVLGRFRGRSMKDAFEDAGVDGRSIWASGLAGGWKAIVARPRTRTIEGSVLRIEPGRILIDGPDGFDGMRRRWFTAQEPIPEDIEEGTWVRITHAAGRIQRIVRA